MTTRIVFAGYQGERSVHTRAGRVFCESLKQKLGDAIAIEFDENIVNRGNKAADLLDMTENGEIDGCYFSSSYLAERVPELGLFDQHFVVPDRHHAYAVLDGSLGQRLASEVEQQTGFKVLGYWDNGLRQLSTGKKAIREVDDCKDLKIRTLKNDNHQRVFRALGFEPLAVDVRDLPAAVEDGTVDAQENPLTNIYNFNLHKSHRFITMTQHLLGVAPMLFNQSSVNSWSAQVKQAVLEAAAEATQAQRVFAEEDDAICIDALRQDGCEIIELNQAQRQSFREATREQVDKTRANFSEELLSLFDSDLAGVNE